MSSDFFDFDRGSLTNSEPKAGERYAGRRYSFTAPVMPET